MPNDINYSSYLMFGIAIVIAISFMILRKVLASPFKYPYYKYNFDISGKRKPQIEDYIDEFLINGGYDDIIKHLDIIKNWKTHSENRVEKSILKNLRKNQYAKSIDDSRAFCFFFTKSQTRYKQVNYVKNPYKVKVTTEEYRCDFDYITNRYNKLREINFECTLNTYHKKNQRKLMTRELREKIMKRDNYTCQFCGKYMPDEVGLHIDHIVPIAKGGKSVESNLQVLCSKCNASKSSK